MSAVPIAEAQSFGALRRVIQRKYSPAGHAERMNAAEAISDHADNNTLRFVIARIRMTSKELVFLRNDMTKVKHRLDELAVKLKKARKLGAGSVNQSDVNEQAKKGEELKDTARAVSHIGDFLEALRKSVGLIVKRLAPEDQDKALKTMIKAYKKGRDPEDKLVVLRVIVSCESPEIQPLLIKLTTSKDELDRLRVLIVAEDWGGLRALRLALVCLEDEAWPVRAQSIRVLKKVGGRRALEFLNAAMVREKGRLKTDAILAMRYLTGENFRTNQHLWKKWFDENRELVTEPTETTNAEPPEEKNNKEEPGGGSQDPLRGKLDAPKRKQEAGGTGFYGVESTSKHVVYVLDFSGSMSHSKTDKAAGNSKITLHGTRRIDRLASELLRAVSALPKGATFNIVTFTHNVSSWRDKMVFATKDNKDALKAWLLNRGPSGATNLFGGLEEAFKFAGRGSYDESYETAADTIFLLSDGQPSAGRLQKTDEILAEIRKVNSLRRIAIHGVYLGSHGGGLVRRLAAEHDGQFVKIPD